MYGRAHRPVCKESCVVVAVEIWTDLFVEEQEVMTLSGL